MNDRLRSFQLGQILWDKKKKTIVNNESAEIIRMFNDEFNDYAKHPEVDLFPPHLKSSMDEINSWTLKSINNCVYRCGFSSTQSAYTQAANELFDALDKCEDILSKQRYIAGNEFTEADVRLFVDFIRFDAVCFSSLHLCITHIPLHLLSSVFTVENGLQFKIVSKGRVVRNQIVT